MRQVCLFHSLSTPSPIHQPRSTKTLAKPPAYMFHLRTENSGCKTVNAIHPASSLQPAPVPTRELEILWRLAELSMEFAELTASEAREEAKATPEQATAKPSRPRQADPRLIFLRFERAVRDTIALIRRLAGGTIAIVPRSPREAAPRPTPEPATIEAPNSPEDPRRAHIARYFREAIDTTRRKHKPPLTQQEIEAHIDAELARDPNHRLEGRVVLLRICKSLNLPFYANRMHPDLFRTPSAPALATP
jgi:hypothetical protein